MIGYFFFKKEAFNELLKFIIIIQNLFQERKEF